MKDALLTICLTHTLKAKIHATSKALDLPMSAIVRGFLAESFEKSPTRNMTDRQLHIYTEEYDKYLNGVDL